MFRFGLDEIQENTFVILILLLSCQVWSDIDGKIIK